MTTTVRARPCSSCPYRRDVPSGIWDQAEYDKLRKYDGDTPEQIENEAFGVFHCHSTPDYVCAGWLGCIDKEVSLALRFNSHRLDPEVWDYVSPVPLFESGAAAAEHGERDIQEPGSDAYWAMLKLRRQIERRDA